MVGVEAHGLAFATNETLFEAEFSLSRQPDVDGKWPDAPLLRWASFREL